MSYLVKTLDPYPPRGFDLSYPADGETDTDSVPYRFLHGAAPSVLEPALLNALAKHQVRWVITLERCTNSTAARASLRAADTVLADAVVLSSDEFVWSVGTLAANRLETTLGIGAVPFAVPSDAMADTVTAEWFPAYQVAISAEVDGDQISGAFGLALDAAKATPAVASAVARTLTAAKQLEPSCPTTCSTDELGFLMRAFDTNQDQVFSASEVEASGWLQMLGFKPELDLLTDVGDGVPTFWPGHDGAAESYAQAYGFSAMRITVQ